MEPDALCHYCGATVEWVGPGTYHWDCRHYVRSLDCKEAGCEICGQAELSSSAKAKDVEANVGHSDPHGEGEPEPVEKVVDIAPETEPEPPGTVSLTLPWSVLASSNLRSGGMVGWTSEEYRKKREAATEIIDLTYGGEPIARPVRISVSYHPPDRRRRDSTNLQKMLLDALKAGGVLEDDKDQIVRAWEGAVHEPSSDPRAEITVTVLDMEGGEAA